MVRAKEEVVGLIPHSEEMSVGEWVNKMPDLDVEGPSLTQLGLDLLVNFSFK